MNEKLDLPQGTLDLLILRALFGGAAHGHAIARSYRADVGGTAAGGNWVALSSFASAEAKGWIEANWELSDKGKRAPSRAQWD
jgi:PadR family transcriptional regulator PadR